MEHCTRCKKITRATGSGSLVFVFCSQHVGGQQGLVNSTVALLSSHLGAPRMSHEHDEYSSILYELKDVCAGYPELPHICTLMSLDFRIQVFLFDGMSLFSQPMFHVFKFDVRLWEPFLSQVTQVTQVSQRFQTISGLK
jgi:hypothetical protein